MAQQGQSGIVSPQNPTGQIYYIGQNQSDPSAPYTPTTTTPTAAQSGYGNPTGGGNYGPTASNPYGWSTVNGQIVANTAPTGSQPNTTPTATGGSAGAAAYATGSGFTPPDSEETIRQQMLSDAQSQIDAINQSFAATLAQEQTQANNNQTDVNASAARMGLMGSPTGGSMLSTQAGLDNQTMAATRAQQATQIAAVYSTVDANALAQANLEQQQAVTDSQSYLKQQQQIAATAQQNAASFAAAGVTGNALQTQDPQTWAQLESQTGMTDYALTAYMNSQLPANLKPQQATSYFPNANGTTSMKVLTIDPTTGKSSEQDYTINAPYSQVNTKGIITGADGQLLMPDPTDPNKYIQITPLSATEQEKLAQAQYYQSEAGTLETSAANGGGTTTTTGGGNGYTASILTGTGIDPAAKMSDVLTQPAQVSALFSAMATAEGGANAAGAQVNNPLDLKYNLEMAALGATDSGIKALDGGTFSAFPDQATANSVYTQVLGGPIYGGLTVDQAMKKWSGYSATPPAQAWSLNDASAPPAGAAGNAVDTSTGRTPNAIYQDAVSYSLSGGNLQSFTGGMSNTTQQKALKNAIDNKSAALADAAGVDRATLQQEFSANSGAIAPLVSYMNSIQRALDGASQTGDQIMAAFKDSGINTSDSALLNESMNTLAKNLSGGQIFSYNAGLQELGNEYSQVFSRGGQNTVQSHYNAQDIVNGNIKLSDLQGVLTELQAAGNIVIKTSIDQVQNAAAGGGTSAVAQFLSYVHGVPYTPTAPDSTNSSSTDYTSQLDALMNQ